ncbi:MAG TPA: PQQ-binding-like beta-propeller repeat protein [Bryobacteraceae bacterium]|nr:PQQ-binding-like beta-propeller repeat protein [Bryobacteraceae bacterium]
MWITLYWRRTTCNGEAPVSDEDCSGFRRFSASAVTADGRLYFPSEDGLIYVVRAGPKFELLARNDMGEVCMATPAIFEDVMLVGTRTHLLALLNGGGPHVDISPQFG